MPGWLIFLIVLALVAVLLSWRSRRRRGRRDALDDFGNGRVDVGERWRTGGYTEGGGGG
jgi:hypothetical protein